MYTRGHQISESDEQFLSGVCRDFHVYTCPANSELQVLGNAINISCEGRHLSFKARVGLFEKWDEIMSKLKDRGLVS